MADQGILVRGSAASFVGIMAMPQNVVQAMLPDGLSLAPQAITPEGEHPVIFAFNQQQDVHMAWGTLRGPGFTYYEFSIGISYVHLKGGQEPFFFAPQLYLDNWVPVLMGRFWGFAKSLAAIKVTPDSWDIGARGNGSYLLSARFQPQGLPAEPAHFPTFATISQMLDQRGLGMPPWGGFSCFSLKQNLAAAKVQAVSLGLTISRAFLPQLPTGTFEIPSIERTALGGFHLQVPWHLALPKRC